MGNVKVKAAPLRPNIVHKVSLMGQATSKDNEAKWKMKHPSDIASQSFIISVSVRIDWNSEMRK